MRDRLNFNSFSLLPIVHDEMNGLAAVATCVKGYAPNISNGYYGFQAVAAAKPQQQEQMEVTVAENNEMCRKRARDCGCGDDVVLKKRRENDVGDDRGQQFVRRWDVRFLEELLRGTHGGDLYNYGAGDDV